MITAKELEIGDEFYRIRFGKSISYYKCSIVNILLNNHGKKIYFYIIKGKSKNKSIRLGPSLDILAHNNLYDNKVQMFKDWEHYINSNLPKKLSKQFEEEILKSKNKQPQHWV